MDDDSFNSQLTLPPALTAHRWGRVYPGHIQACLDRMQKSMHQIAHEIQAASDGVLLEVERAYTKGYNDELAAAAALTAEAQNHK